MTISTHVLDASLGRPAAGMDVVLARRSDDGTWAVLRTGITDDDGRCPELTADLDVPVGIYQLAFATGDYFARSGTATFYPFVELTFGVADAGAHHHVPLLLSPFAFSTYRGS
jgi:5-hydroxyisourate hydrolase